ncbi:MAG: hypothetical protein WCQ70_06220 [Lentimicrobiaceae bacterium]
MAKLLKITYRTTNQAPTFKSIPDTVLRAKADTDSLKKKHGFIGLRMKVLGKTLGNKSENVWR